MFRKLQLYHITTELMICMDVNVLIATCHPHNKNQRLQLSVLEVIAENV